MKNVVKTGLLVILIGVLCIPMLQYYFPTISMKPLEGSYEKKSLESFSWKGWFEGTFQSNFDDWYNENFGFRNFFVRLHNQLNYSVFTQTNSHKIVIGKNGYLYEEEYIKSYFGQNFQGINNISETVNTISATAEYLKEHNTQFLIVIAPGKGYFYPEYIPNYLITKKDSTNYDVFLAAIKSSGIPCLDFNRVFLNRKDTASFVLYPKTGIHWSQASIPFVLDSLNKFVEALTKIDMYGMKYSYPEPTPFPDRQDTDIERSMNLLFPLENELFVYPNYVWEPQSNKRKPKAIFIGDSFFWQIYNLGTNKRFYDDAEFWYYFKQAHAEKYSTPPEVKDLDILNKLIDSDIVVLFTSEANLHIFPFGFESVYGNFNLKDRLIEEKTQKLIRYIRTDKNWFHHIKEKAEVKNISVDSMLYLDAKYMILNQKK